jgi:hypothetical protein
VKNFRSDSISSPSRPAFSLRVSARTVLGSTRWIRRLSCRGSTPGAAATEIWSSLPRRSVTRCASGRVSVAEAEPPVDASPSRLMPTIR